MYYSMARRSGKLQGWATASNIHHNHHRGRCQQIKVRTPDSCPETCGEARGHPLGRLSLAGHLKTCLLFSARIATHARTTSGLVCSALAWNTMHGASVKPRTCPSHLSAKPSWRCQAAWSRQKMRSARMTRIRAARGSRSGPQPDGAGTSMDLLGLPLSTEPDK